MVKVEFTEAMKQLLAGIKGQQFESYECAIDDHNQIYGNFRINTDQISIDVVNEARELPFFDSCEDIAGFSCAIADKPFESCSIANVTVFNVKEKITSVEILNDVIDVNDGMYQVSFDNALIVRTSFTTYMFARDVWFSEFITIRKDDNYEQVISMQNIIDSWSNEGEYSVNIHRTIKTL